MFCFIIVYSRYANAEMLKKYPGEMVAEKRGGIDFSESERNYCVQGKEELMFVIIEGSE